MASFPAILIPWAWGAGIRIYDKPAWMQVIHTTIICETQRQIITCSSSGNLLVPSQNPSVMDGTQKSARLSRELNSSRGLVFIPLSKRGCSPELCPRPSSFWISPCTYAASYHFQIAFHTLYPLILRASTDLVTCSRYRSISENHNLCTSLPPFNSSIYYNLAFVLNPP